MRKKLYRILIFFLAAALLLSGTALAAPGGTGETLYEYKIELADGFTYTRVISYNSKEQQVDTYYLDAACDSEVYPVAAVCGSLDGGCTVSEVVAFAEAQGMNVLGAINADFFSPSGVPLGVLVENGRLLSSASGENVLAFDDDGAFVCEKPTVSITLANLGGGERGEETAGKSVSLNNLNKQRVDTGGMYLLTHEFSSEPLNFSSDGWSVRLRILDGSLRMTETTTLVVEEILESGVTLELPEDCVVLTAATGSGFSGVTGYFSVGDTVTLNMECSDERLAACQWAVGCGDILAADGVMLDWTGWETALYDYHPRTAVGIREDGSIVAYVADGRSTQSYGARLTQVATDLLALGCSEVVNLDGGGSSIMAVRMPGQSGCTVVNSPSLGKERRCASYLLFVTDPPEEKEAGEAHRLFLIEDSYVLTGSSIELYPIATDAYARNTETPQDIIASSSGLGSVDGIIYTAGTDPGDDKIELASASTGAYGSGTIHVVDTVDSLTVYDVSTGTAPELLELTRYDSVQLTAALEKLSRTVYADSTSFSYSVSNEKLGTVSEDGLYIADGTPGAVGELTVSAGGQTVTFPVSIQAYFTDVIDSWAEDYVNDLYEAGIVVGGDNLLYYPMEDVRRCDFILMLWRAAGMPAAEGAAAFDDVPEDAYYGEALAWAQGIGVAQGCGDGNFDPTGSLTREQAFSLICRYLQYVGALLPEADPIELAQFTDTPELAGYAVDSACMLISLGIVQGADGLLMPKKEISRMEVAKILDLALSRFWEVDTDNPYGEYNAPTEDSDYQSDEPGGLPSDEGNDEYPTDDQVDEPGEAEEENCTPQEDDMVTDTGAGEIVDGAVEQEP